MAEKICRLLLILALAGCTPLSSNVKRYNALPAPIQTQNGTVARSARKIDTSEVIKTAVGCRYYQTDVIIPGVRASKPLKFAQVLAASLNRAKKKNPDAAVRCRRSGNDIIYTVGSIGEESNGFSFGYEEGKLILNGIAKGNGVRKCSVAAECASRFLNETSLDLR